MIIINKISHKIVTHILWGAFSLLFTGNIPRGLVGAMEAYSNMTGENLKAENADAATEELVNHQ